MSQNHTFQKPAGKGPHLAERDVAQSSLDRREREVASNAAGGAESSASDPTCSASDASKGTGDGTERQIARDTAQSACRRTCDAAEGARNRTEGQIACDSSKGSSDGTKGQISRDAAQSARHGAQWQIALRVGEGERK